LKQGKTLRVSFPEGEQRSSPLLGQPWKYAIANTVVVILTHLALSQTLFVAQTTAYSSDGSRVPETDATALAYSPLGPSAAGAGE